MTNLTKLKLILGKKVTFAADLLFGDPDFSIRIERFKAKDTIIDDLVARGPLFGIVEKAMTFIKKHIKLILPIRWEQSKEGEVAVSN